jgi:hypothetical protein
MGLLYEAALEQPTDSAAQVRTVWLSETTA